MKARGPFIVAADAARPGPPFFLFLFFVFFASFPSGRMNAGAGWLAVWVVRLLGLCWSKPKGAQDSRGAQDS